MLIECLSIEEEAWSAMASQICTVHPRLSESRLSDTSIIQTPYVSYCACSVNEFQDGGHYNFSSVCSQHCYGLFAVKQKRNNAALSVECKMLFFTMEILRIPRVLFLSVIQISEQNHNPSTLIESATRSFRIAEEVLNK